MGCDIHAYAETRDSVGAWSAVLDSDGTPTRFCDYRSYDTFAILASVRNGGGFAGIKTSDGFNPIARPRGIPFDASPECQKMVDDYGEDGHSHSFLSLSELLEFDWLQTTIRRGIIPLQTWFFWSRYEKPRGRYPNTFSSAIGGNRVKVIVPSDAEKMQGVKPGPDENMSYHVDDEWELPYYRAAAMLWSEDIPRLMALAKTLPGASDTKDYHDRVRLVFFFDN